MGSADNGTFYSGRAELAIEGSGNRERRFFLAGSKGIQSWHRKKLNVFNRRFECYDAATQMRPSHASSAVFLSTGTTHRADRCEPLCDAVRRGEVRLCALARRGYPGQPLPPQLLPGISTVGFWDAPGPQSWGLDWHRNEGIEITYLSRGRIDFQVDAEEFRLESGHLTITRPWQRHRLGRPNIGSSRLHWLILDVGVRRPNQAWKWPGWIILSPCDRQRLTVLLSQNEQPVWLGNGEIAACFDRLAQLVDTERPTDAQTKVRLSINELLVMLLDLLQEKKATLDAGLTSTRRTVELFLSALPHHVDQPWTLAEMARQCGLGTSAFTDYCRQITNLPPGKYLARCRVEAAKSLLRAKPESSITSVAFDCGFQSSQYLATAFRRITGQSPREFRAS
ncbi:MAG: helix-turn-helix domain-containing protein [Verrucomicrobiia bacterium]